jgi:hypothetical protein
MVKHEERPAILKELDYRRAGIQEELATVVHTDTPGESALTRRMRDTAIRRALRHMAIGRASGLWRMRDWKFYEGRLARAAKTSGLDLLPPRARELVWELNRVEVLRSYHKTLRFWTIFHLVFTGLGVQLMVWHVAIVALYPR